MARHAHSRFPGWLLLVVLLAADGAQGGTKVQPPEIEEAVRAFLTVRCPNGGERAEITFRAVPENIEVPGTSYRLHVAGDARTEWKGAIAVRVEVESEGRIVHRCLVSLLIRTYAEVLVAERVIGRHAELKPEDVRTVHMETTLMRRRVLIEPGPPEGLRSRQIIPRGSILYEDLFESVPLVQQGDRVLVKVQTRGISMSTEGIARGDGGRGEYVVVDLTGRHERIRARVDGSGSVIVPLDAGKEN